MLFTQIEFFVLLAVVLGFCAAVRSHSVRKWLLLAASYYFYAYWDWRFCGLILGSTLIDYIAGRMMGRSVRPLRRRAWLLLSLCANLGALGFFKYFNFFVDSLQQLLGPTGLELGTLNVILPVGISFYTFQTLSYSIDVYRGKLEAVHDFRDFALFVAFFPQLVAGPIVRASDFLPQLRESRRITATGLFEGGRQFVVGLFLKVFIADNLAPYVDEVFANAGAYNGAATWLAAVAYSVQIFCDFAGYSDMAIGVARMLGYQLPVNFNFPYLAQGLSDFWRRWHISLSTWLRDYLYIPLGGNRKGPRRTYINLMLTMLLGGLWHGAAWTFVFWGFWHGLGLAAERLVRDHGVHAPTGGVARRAAQFGSWAATMVFVVVGWVFFRSPDFATALIMLRQMFVPQPGFVWLAPFPLIALALVAAVHIIRAAGHVDWLALQHDRLKTPIAIFTMLWLVLIYRPRGFTPFIYFQF